jgi:hypothetical protein
MDTMTLEPREADLRDDEPLPRRPRRQFFNRRSAALAALVTCAAGFYAGIRVEKGQLSSSTTGLRIPSATGTAGAGAAGAGAAGAGAAGAGGARAGAAGAAGSGAGSARGGTRAGGFPGFGGGAGGGSASVGTVASVNGKTLVLTEISGNTVKVRLTSSTKISKSLPVSRHAVRPGDTIIVQGAPNSQGTTVAASVTDSGAGASRGSASGSSGASAGGSSSGGSSSGGSGGGVGSLFSGG